MKKTCLTLFAHILLLTNLHGQQFLPGKVTYLSGQTETGRIRVKDWALTPQSIEFRNTSDASIQLNIRQLSAFEVTRPDKHTEYYVRAKASVNRSPVAPASLDTSPAPRMVPDTVFLQVLVESEIDLLVLREPSGARHFFIRKDKALQELIYKEYLVKRADRSAPPTVRAVYGYRQQLQELAGGCLKIQETKDLRYSWAELRKIIEKINECRGAALSYRYSLEKTPSSWSISAGATHTKFPFLDEKFLNTDLNIAIKMSAGKINPFLAAGFEYFIPISKRKVSFYNELAFTIQSGQGRAVYTIRQFDAEIKMYYLELNNAFRYHFPVFKNNKLFIGLGISNGLAINKKHLITETMLTVPPQSETYPLLSGDINYKGGYRASLGWKTGPLVFEWRYGGDFGQGLERVVFSTTTQAFILSFQF